MIEITTNQAHLAIFALSLSLVLALLASLAKVTRLNGMLAVELRQTRDLHAMMVIHGESHLVVDAALNRLENKLAEIADHDLELQSQAAINRSFKDACRLAREGVPAQSLVHTCGLSKGEAELMVRLHQS